MIYVASPYSDPDVSVQRDRYLETSYVVAQLMIQRLAVFSPIVHCHEIALRYNLPGDAKYWQEYNTSFLRRANALYIVCLPGWKHSKGVRQEVTLAQELNIPMRLVEPGGAVSPDRWKGFSS
jgi:hypothetical protein